MSAYHYSVPSKHLVAITSAVIYRMAHEGLSITGTTAAKISKLGDRLLSGSATPKDVEIALQLFDRYLDPRS